MNAPSHRCGEETERASRSSSCWESWASWLVLGALAFQAPENRWWRKGQRSGLDHEPAVHQRAGRRLYTSIRRLSHPLLKAPSGHQPSTGSLTVHMFEYLPRIYGGGENYRVFRRPGAMISPSGVSRTAAGPSRDRVMWSYARNPSLPQKKGQARLDNSFKRALLPLPRKPCCSWKPGKTPGCARESRSADLFRPEKGWRANAWSLSWMAATANRVTSAGPWAFDEEGQPQISGPETKTLWVCYCPPPPREPTTNPTEL